MLKGPPLLTPGFALFFIGNRKGLFLRFSRVNLCTHIVRKRLAGGTMFKGHSQSPGVVRLVQFS